jgi:hypothetical protein
MVIEDWRREYSQHRPHSFVGYKPPVPEAKMLENLTSGVEHLSRIGHIPNACLRGFHFKALERASPKGGQYYKKFLLTFCFSSPIILESFLGRAEESTFLISIKPPFAYTARTSPCLCWLCH